MYTDVNLNISDSEKQKVKTALAAGTQLSLRLSHEDLVSNDVKLWLNLNLIGLRKRTKPVKVLRLKCPSLKSRIIWRYKEDFYRC